MQGVEFLRGEEVAALGNKGSSHGIDDRGLALFNNVSEAPRTSINVGEVFSKVESK